MCFDESVHKSQRGNFRQQTSSLARSSSHSVLLVFIVEQNLAVISAVVLVVFYRRLGPGLRITRHWPLHENITSSTKPEVHNYRATATDNKHKEFGKVRSRGFRVMRVDR